jgi:hypothetical protein
MRSVQSERKLGGRIISQKISVGEIGDSPAFKCSEDSTNNCKFLPVLYECDSNAPVNAPEEDDGEKEETGMIATNEKRGRQLEYDV